mmetsp:Transcript_22662/g.52313  ORF Transcript_22662/g.52313 Transcript_22662/m.52313 type:complete len:153 (+) Transcript_22662:1234-1692(+)
MKRLPHLTKSSKQRKGHRWGSVRKTTPMTLPKKILRSWPNSRQRRSHIGKKKIIQQILKWEEEGHDWKTKEVGNIKFAIDESFLESVDQARIERQEYLKRISPDKWSRRTIRKLKRAKMERLLRDKADREGLPYSTVLERSGFYEYLHEPEE